MSQSRESDERRICQLFEATLTACIPPKKPKASFFGERFSDGLNAVRAQYQEFKDGFYLDLNLKMIKEEGERLKYEMKKSLLRELQSERKKVADASKVLIDLEEKKNQDRIKLEKQKRLLTEQANLKRGEKEIKIAEQIQADNKAFDVFNAQIKSLQDKRGNIIKSSCCLRFFPCCAPENADLKAIDKEIDTHLHELDDIKRMHIELKQKQSHDLSQDLEEIDRKLEEIDQHFVEQKHLAQETLDKEEKQLLSLENEEKRDEKFYYDSVGVLSMVAYVRVYALFINYANAIHSACTQYKEGHDNQLNDTHTQLSARATADKQEIDKLMNQICWKFQDFTAMVVYKKFLKLSEPERQTILTGKADVALIKKLFNVKLTAESTVLFADKKAEQVIDVVVPDQKAAAHLQQDAPVNVGTMASLSVSASV